MTEDFDEHGKEIRIPLSDLFPSREYDPLTPPGYYVNGSKGLRAGPCRHCKGPGFEHLPPDYFCPYPPMFTTVR